MKIDYLSKNEPDYAISLDDILDELEAEIEKYEVESKELQTGVVEMDIIRSCIEQRRNIK